MLARLAKDEGGGGLLCRVHRSGHGFVAAILILRPARGREGPAWEDVSAVEEAIEG